MDDTRRGVALKIKECVDDDLHEAGVDRDVRIKELAQMRRVVTLTDPPRNA